MIKAYILIETNGGIKYKYVNSTVNDTAGIDEQYYSYRGNAYQELGLTILGEYESADTGLEREIDYYYKVNVDASGVVEYKINFPIIKGKTYISFTELVRMLNRQTDDYYVKLIGKDVRFISNGLTASTSIALTAGTTGTDLFTTLNASIEVAKTSDNYLDQTGSGTVKGDYDNLIAVINTGTAKFLTFPDDGGTTNTLVRKNLNNDTEELTFIRTTFPLPNISSLQVIEEVVPD